MAAKFVAEEGLLKGLILPLDEGDQWIIGRDPDACQLLIEDPAASRRHLFCRLTPRGITVENLSSTNPVQINDVELTSPRLLKNGDFLKIGSGAFRFYAEGSSPAAASRPKKKDLEDIFSEEDLEDERHAHNASQPHRKTLLSDDAAEEEGLLADIDFGMIESGRWLLKVISGPNAGAEFTMRSGGSYIVGTDPKACDIIFNDTSVSRKHARIRVSEDDLITIEDLESRNGTFVDGQKIEERHALDSNIVVNVGTTAFVIFDREGEMQTIISPLLPSIVKVLQQEPPSEEVENDSRGEKTATKQKSSGSAAPVQREQKKVREDFKEKSHRTLTAFILIAIITGLFVLMGIGMVTLFQNTPDNPHALVDADKKLAEALAPFSGVQQTYNATTGKLILGGHVLTENAKRQLESNLQGLDFIKSLEDEDVVIDQKVVQDLNPRLARNPAWKGISLQLDGPGKFVLRGYLKTRQQMDTLVDDINSTFQYPNNLTYGIIVEEDVIAQIKLDLARAGLQGVKPSISNGGDIVLQGNIPSKNRNAFDKIVEKIAKIPGVRNVQDLVNEVEQTHSAVDITDRYIVTGVSQTGGNVSVVVDGRIVSKGDVLDGMVIEEINTKSVILEKNGVQYKIDLHR